MNCERSNNLITTAGEKFTFSILVEHDVPEDVVLAMELGWNTAAMNLSEDHGRIDESCWTRPTIERTRGGQSTVKFRCKDMVVYPVGVYWIKAFAWFPEPVSRPKWEC